MWHMLPNNKIYLSKLLYVFVPIGSSSYPNCGRNTCDICWSSPIYCCLYTTSVCQIAWYICQNYMNLSKLPYVFVLLGHMCPICRYFYTSVDLRCKIISDVMHQVSQTSWVSYSWVRGVVTRLLLLAEHRLNNDEPSMTNLKSCKMSNLLHGTNTQML